ncbi:hypothetical protein L486_03689 [Kwoniella mangroviensis CBS 10435]|uniref:DUF962 domain-containing protein n=1 Tax=Kwoniella mangroviensis CBS 10435 TaxID=1331196 RepID=A0A1B9IUJ7_9TREE|nr:uncharacterized protein I203_02374 [Kwoniella mangroviensis CBS 8507]OCF59187.1 hypothetical protein L486_03689 [Kwoniella mangroviensis CBS 10435]OCF68979.1 hypothetical protein I203_02374 [Kwoniella mangroviensis CBS 8507]OCF76560.1 hypothetical protein I204_02257 [Kwoniella mangroviensis CBS 8886]
MSSSKSSSLINPTYTPVPSPPGGFKSFQSFYPFYLGEHSLPLTRRLHLVGTSIALTSFARSTLSLVPIALSYAARSLPPSGGAHALHNQGFITSLGLDVILAKWSVNTQFLELEGIGRWLLGGVVGAYAFAWIGHFFIEKNRPATFKYPIWSLRGDLKMWWEVVTLRRDV